MPYPRFQRARNFKFARSTGATLGNTSWGAVDSAIDITVEAQTGDVLEITLSTRISDVNANAAEVDAVTMNGSTPVNSVWNQAAAPSGTTGGGAPPWFINPSVYSNYGAPLFYTVVASDVFSNQVKISLRYRTGGATPTRTMFNPQFSVKNLGPADPN